MIDVVFPALRFLYRDQIDDMFTIRTEAVERWGWSVPGSENAIDKDQFDNDEAIYLLHLSADRKQVLACCRLIPTTSPYMLGEIFPHTCDLQPLPKSASVWEASRLVLASNRLSSQEEYLNIMWMMGLALSEFCLQSGIKSLVWYANQPLYQVVNSICEVEPLGRPHHNLQDDETYIPALSHMTETSLSTARARFNGEPNPITYTYAPVEALDKSISSALSGEV